MPGLMLALVTCMSLLQPCAGYSTGAPSEACLTLRPGHGGQPGDNADSPYQLTVSPSSLEAGSDLSITLAGTGFLTRAEFKGFIIQVRGLDGNSLGTFSTSDGLVTYLHCASVQDTVTHSSSQPKTSITISWSPPPSLPPTQVYVSATVVKDYGSYWVDIRSGRLMLRGRGEQDNEMPDVASEHQTELELDRETQPEPEPNLKEKHPVYTGCSETKSCFGLPVDCEADGDCDILSSWVVEGNITVIELYSRSGHGRYAALALSEDRKMGEDFVISCVEAGGVPRVEHSWNYGKSNQMIVDMEGTRLVEGSMKDGEDLYCKIARNNWIIGYPPLAGSGQFLYELDKRKYHLLISGGSYSKSLTYHGPGMAQASQEEVDLTHISSIKTYFNILLKAHGVLMVVAWLGCAGSGTVLARYFKDTWKDSSCCGQDQWFIWHRFFMILVWAATIAGVVCVVLDVRGWPYDKDFIMKNPHPVLGGAALILTFIQPFIALCRPPPASSARWIFNWTHWFVGNSAHVIAIMAIFFAIELPRAELERTVTWVLVAYVAFHVASHLIFSINMCWAELNNRSDIYPLSGRISENSAFIEDLYLTKDKRGGSCRKFCFGLYFVITWSLSVFVVMMILMAPASLLGDKHLGHSHQHQDHQDH